MAKNRVKSSKFMNFNKNNKVNNNKFHIFYTTLAVFVTALVVFPFMSSAQIPTDCQSFLLLLDRIAYLMQAIAGGVATIMVLIAAFKYISAGDDAQKIKSAHQTITWAVVGIFVAMMAFAVPDIILNFIGESLNCM